MDLGLFSKYQNITPVERKTLFDPPILSALKKSLCPYCGKPLKITMRGVYICPRKKCPHYINCTDKKGKHKNFVVRGEIVEKLDNSARKLMNG